MQGTETWQFIDGERTISVRPQGRFKADNGTALAVAAVAGLGIAWLPRCLIEDHLASGALTPVMTRYPPPTAGMFVVRPPGQHPARKVRVLTEVLIEHFGSSAVIRTPPSWAGARAMGAEDAVARCMKRQQQGTNAYKLVQPIRHLKN